MASHSLPASLSILQNAALILLSAFFFPLLTTIAIVSTFISPFLPVSKHIHHYRRWRSLSSSTFRPRTVLITDLHTPQAIALARTFYRAGHRVVGAGYESYYLPIPAHFSRSVEIFYRLEGRGRDEKYVRDLLDIVRKEKVELWVNCSGEDTDLEIKEVLELEEKCQVIQFRSEVLAVLRDDLGFGKCARKLGLNVLETHLITSETEALVVLSHQKTEAGRGKHYVIKSVSSKDTTSSSITLLSHLSATEVETYTKPFHPTPSRPLLLQGSIQGLQYIAHALIVNSKPAAFVAYPTSSTQLTPLPASSLLSCAMLEYTTQLTTALSPSTSTSITGHLSINFAIPSHLAQESESKFGVPDPEVHALVAKIHAIACSPNPSLGALAFADVSEDLASEYLSILPDHEPKGVSNVHWEEKIVVPMPGIRGYCFLGFELVILVILPVWDLVRVEIGVRGVIEVWMEFLGRVLWWRDGWWEAWDPWVGWWAYGGYAVGSGLVGLWEGGLAGLENSF